MDVELTSEVKTARKEKTEDDLLLCQIERGFKVESGQKTIFRLAETIKIPQCRFVGLLGHSGAGKSVIFKQVLGISDVIGAKASGKLITLGQERTLASFRPSVGYSPQEAVFYKGFTVRQTLEYASEFANRMKLEKGCTHKSWEWDKIRAEKLRVKRRCSQDTHNDAQEADPTATDRQPHTAVEWVMLCVGLEKKTAETCVESLSGGERKRLTIAMEALYEPEYFFLDEPTSALDSAGALDICCFLSALCNVCNVSVIAVLHQPANSIYQCLDYLLLLLADDCQNLLPIQGYINKQLTNGRSWSEVVESSLLQHKQVRVVDSFERAPQQTKDVAACLTPTSSAKYGEGTGPSRSAPGFIYQLYIFLKLLTAQVITPAGRSAFVFDMFKSISLGWMLAWLLNGQEYICPLPQSLVLECVNPSGTCSVLSTVLSAGGLDAVLSQGSLAVTATSFSAFLSSLDQFLADIRPNRHFFHKNVSSLAYFIAKELITVFILQSVLCFLFLWFFSVIPLAGNLGWHFLNLVFVQWISAQIAFGAAMAVEEYRTSMVLGGLILQMSIAFSGGNPGLKELRDRGLVWLADMTYQRWALENFYQTEINTYTSPTCNTQQSIEEFGYSNDNRLNWVWLALIFFVFLCLSLIALFVRVRTWLTTLPIVNAISNLRYKKRDAGVSGEVEKAKPSNTSRRCDRCERKHAERDCDRFLTNQGDLLLPTNRMMLSLLLALAGIGVAAAAILGPSNTYPAAVYPSLLVVTGIFFVFSAVAAPGGKSARLFSYQRVAAPVICASILFLEGAFYPFQLLQLDASFFTILCVIQPILAILLYSLWKCVSKYRKLKKRRITVASAMAPAGGSTVGTGSAQQSGGASDWRNIRTAVSS